MMAIKMLWCSLCMSLIRKGEPDKTSVCELIESQQGLPVAIPVLEVKRKIHIRKLLPEFVFVRIFAFIRGPVPAPGTSCLSGT